jgi:hypothetical protein
MHDSVLEGTLVQIQHVEDIFFAEILRNSDIPVKRINIIMLTSIFLEKYINKKCPTCRRIELLTSPLPSQL